MDFIQRLRIFVALTENRSFARTAEALRMTRPGVTNAINALEDSVGARLFHRTTRRVSLTGEGEQLNERALQLLADLDDTQGLFGGSGERPRGRLRADIPVAIAKPFIIPALPQFIAAYPDVEVILGVSDSLWICWPRASIASSGWVICRNPAWWAASSRRWRS